MAPRPGIFEPITRSFRPHAWLYGTAMLLGLALAVLWSAAWLFWPLMIWSLLFLVHFLVTKSLEVTNDWVDERTERTTLRAQDISHIESIRERYENSIAPAAAQEPENGAKPEEAMKKRC